MKCFVGRLKAAKAGDAKAQLALAHEYASRQDFARLREWLRLAADQGNLEAQNELAWLLATSGSSEMRDGASAVKFAERAVTAAGRTNGRYLNTLAAAYAEIGDFERAVKVQDEATTFTPDQESKTIFKLRRALYESRNPCREEFGVVLMSLAH